MLVSVPGTYFLKNPIRAIEGITNLSNRKSLTVKILLFSKNEKASLDVRLALYLYSLFNVMTS
jgi:hypothetical protein